MDKDLEIIDSLNKLKLEEKNDNFIGLLFMACITQIVAIQTITLERKNFALKYKKDE